MKETEEILHKILGEDLVYWPHNVLTICEKYHQERLKSSLPSEQEMADYFCDNRSVDANNDWESYKKGFQDVLTLLTKGR